MKKIILIMLLALFPIGSVDAAYYIKIDDIEGESTADATATTRTEVDSGETRTDGDVEVTWKVEEGESAATPGVEPDEIDNKFDDDSTTKKGNVETEWKVEEGESAMENSGVEPDEIDVAADGLENAGIEPDEIDNKFDDDPQESNFAILLSGGDDEKNEESGKEVSEILKQGLAEADMPVEEVAFNFEKITTRLKKSVKLFGFIPVETMATVEIDTNENVKVKFPWWTFFASGKDQDNLGQQIFQTLSNVLKAKHETVKNAINNIR